MTNGFLYPLGVAMGASFLTVFGAVFNGSPAAGFSKPQAKVVKVVPIVPVERVCLFASGAFDTARGKVSAWRGPTAISIHHITMQDGVGILLPPEQHLSWLQSMAKQWNCDVLVQVPSETPHLRGAVK